MKALVATGRGGAELREVPEPEPGHGDVLIEVAATSLNRGELNRLRGAAEGWRPGWDIAGTVLEATAGGPGPGARVVGMADGAGWAERIALPASRVAELPGGVGFEQAAALPTAAVTALRLLRLDPAPLGRRVVITGAAGGVGRFAVQLARRSGAETWAVVGRPERAAGLAELGADHVVVGIDELKGPFDLILDAVGGDTMPRLAMLLGRTGLLVVYGNSSNQPSTFADVREFYLGGLRRIQGFTLFSSFPADPPARDLSYLAGLVASGELDPHVEAVMPWTDLEAGLERLDSRSLAGKLILKVG